MNTVDWVEPNIARLIDQTKLPHQFMTVNIHTYTEMEEAIRNMLVRGAPAIGVAGAFGFLLGAIQYSQETDNNVDFVAAMLRVSDHLIAARPTAVNLEWAVRKLLACVESYKDSSVPEIVDQVKKLALQIHEEDLQACHQIGDNGAALITKQGASILTHCNAGGLATVGYGTALGVIRSAFKNDSTIKVFADETRPRQQGSKLTVWELMQDGIDTTLITDGMCAHLMSRGMIDYVVVGADRIAANGDTANKIGTHTVAVVAKAYNVPFYIAAPVSTIDPNIPDGSHIPIEERSEEEIKRVNGAYICPESTKVFNPGFDVTPAHLISGIITEKGVLEPDYKQSIANIFS